MTLVCVALSGGVDSAVVLWMAKNSFPQVVGLTHRHWPESKCCSTECIDHCRHQSNQWNIPFFSIDTMATFAEEIVEDFVKQYENGFTPNPCVLCNQKNRFGKMLEVFFEKYPQYRTENYLLATGHYARIVQTPQGKRLARGLDPEKDQSYMLYRLNQYQIDHAYFPLGELKKEQVRKIAAEQNLWSAKTSDSQDICFVPGEYRDFLKEYTGRSPTPGAFLSKTGEILGSHHGVSHYNRGQRKGLGLAGGPWYVLDINVQKNQVILGKEEDLFTTELCIHQCHFPGVAPSESFECSVQLRYHGKVYAAKVSPQENSTYRISLSEPCRDFSPGQSAVLYHDDIVIGGGILLK